jgi:hypothetical protein
MRKLTLIAAGVIAVGVIATVLPNILHWINTPATPRTRYEVQRMNLYGKIGYRLNMVDCADSADQFHADCPLHTYSVRVDHQDGSMCLDRSDRFLPPNSGAWVKDGEQVLPCPLSPEEKRAQQNALCNQVSDWANEVVREVQQHINQIPVRNPPLPVPQQFKAAMDGAAGLHAEVCDAKDLETATTASSTGPASVQNLISQGYGAEAQFDATMRRAKHTGTRHGPIF